MNMMDISRKTPTSTSQFDGVFWNNSRQKWMTRMRFSNGHVRFQKYLGLFDNEKEASEWRETLKEHVEQINESLKDVADIAEFKRKVDDEIKKLR